MQLNTLLAISPVDGRYADKCQSLRPIFSEFGLLRFRVIVEIRWLEMLADVAEIEEVPQLTRDAKKFLQAIIDNFDENDAESIKAFERKINHDVKAVEYFLKEKFKTFKELEQIHEFIHFACTSEDINNLAYALMLKTARSECLQPLLDPLLTKLSLCANNYAEIPLLARTHGQPASPTTVGKEFANFVMRIRRQYQAFFTAEILGKINGAVGNFNAHRVAYPHVNWPKLSQKFVESLGLVWNSHTTQIEPHDFIATLCHSLMRLNLILIDLNRDMWGYISLDYFKQQAVASEVGSSTMPHKINPIDFENSEGNLSVANTLLDFFARQLPTSRWQRDLIDSTVLRNLGVALAHSMIGYQSLMRGLNKLDINVNKIAEDLNKHWEILTEAIQTCMRRYGLEVPYERLKDLSRGKVLDQQIIANFINETELPEAVKQELIALTPASYIGYAADLAKI